MCHLIAYSLYNDLRLILMVLSSSVQKACFLTFGLILISGTEASREVMRLVIDSHSESIQDAEMVLGLSTSPSVQQ